MSIPLTATEILNREFLQIRAKLLEVAATFDRLERAEGSVGEDHRLAQIKAAIDVLNSNEPARAERLQLVFSLPYQADWLQTHQASSSEEGV